MRTKILLVESDATFAGELRRELVARGCEVVVCEDGEGALREAEAHRPDLVVLAVELRASNGFSVCNRLKRHAELRSVPLMLTSSECDEETFEQHAKLRTRADDYVRRPIALPQLLERIARFVPGLPSAAHPSAAFREPLASAESADVGEEEASSVEGALARAIDRASAAGRWDVVQQLTRELEARRRS